jgi:hypothetical protein
MSIDSQRIVSEAWNLAHVLRDNGLSYLTVAVHRPKQRVL